MSANLYAVAGFACSKQMYQPLVDHLKNAQHTLVANDNWGVGESKILGKKNYSLKDLALYHWSLIDDQKLNTNKDIVLVGTSMGGFIVQEMALLRPHDIAAVIFLCTLGPKKNGFIPPVALTEEGLRAFHNFPKDQRAFFGTEGTVHPSLKTNHPIVYQSIIQYRMDNDVAIDEQVEQNKAAVNFLETEINYELIQHLPALILHGKEDRFVSPKNSEIFQTKFKHSKVALIPEADHFFFMEKPEAVCGEITQFLKNIKTN